MHGTNISRMHHQVTNVDRATTAIDTQTAIAPGAMDASRRFLATASATGYGAAPSRPHAIPTAIGSAISMPDSSALSHSTKPKHSYRTCRTPSFQRDCARFFQISECKPEFTTNSDRKASFFYLAGRHPRGPRQRPGPASPAGGRVAGRRPRHRSDPRHRSPAPPNCSVTTPASRSRSALSSSG